jgi:DNA-binding transcriptional ArsR family regulator
MMTLPTIKADLFRALAHPLRIRLLELLSQGERNVQTLQQELPAGQPVVSQHLAALRAQELVAARRVGTQSFYRLRDPKVAALLRVARELLSSRLTASRSMLRELDRERRRV